MVIKRTVAHNTRVVVFEIYYIRVKLRSFFLEDD